MSENSYAGKIGHSNKRKQGCNIHPMPEWRRGEGECELLALAAAFPEIGLQLNEAAL